MKTMAKTVSMIVLYLTMNVLVVQHAAAATTPSRWATACLKALRFKPPGISFEKQLTALNGAILQLPKNERDLWISPEIDWFEENFSNHTPLLESPLPYESKTFQTSFKKIVTVFETGRKFDNTWVLINGDLFLEGYYRVSRYFDNENKKNDTDGSELARLPYFRFNLNTNTYEYSREKAHEVLLKHLESTSENKQTLTLYRGLGKSQVIFLKLLKVLGQGSVNIHTLKNLQQKLQGEWAKEAYSAAWIEEFTSFFEAMDLSVASNQRALEQKLVDFFLAPKRWKESLFTTPTKDKAEGYTDPHLIKAEISFKDLRELADAGEVYVGVEFEDFELLFYGPKALRLFAQNATLEK